MTLVAFSSYNSLSPSSFFLPAREIILIFFRDLAQPMHTHRDANAKRISTNHVESNKKCMSFSSNIKAVNLLKVFSRVRNEFKPDVSQTCLISFIRNDVGRDMCLTYWIILHVFSYDGEQLASVTLVCKSVCMLVIFCDVNIGRHNCYLQFGWHPVAVVQYTFTHKQ